MIDISNIEALIGADVTDAADEKIGTVGQIFVDPATGRPRWVSVRHTGLVSGHWVVPLEDATSTLDAITVPYDKKVIKHAPKTDVSGSLTPEEDAALSSYYDGAEQNAASSLPSDSDKPRHAK